MSQSRRHSLEEQVVSQVIGWLVSLFIYAYIAPLAGVTVSLRQSFALTAVFMVASIIRGYLLRRWYNHRTIQRTRTHEQHQ